MRARSHWVVEEAKPLSPWRYYWLAFKRAGQDTRNLALTQVLASVGILIAFVTYAAWTGDLDWPSLLAPLIAALAIVVVTWASQMLMAPVRMANEAASIQHEIGRFIRDGLQLRRRALDMPDIGNPPDNSSAPFEVLQLEIEQWVWAAQLYLLRNMPHLENLGGGIDYSEMKQYEGRPEYNQIVHDIQERIDRLGEVRAKLPPASSTSVDDEAEHSGPPMA
jgi:hypothetical protein